MEAMTHDTHDFDKCLNDLIHRVGKLQAYETLRERGVMLEQELQQEGSLEEPIPENQQSGSWLWVSGGFLIVTVGYILMNY